ncbi:MAG: AI-2E family transporter [Kiritimatiellae bacterium]|nr:AI-2E family transporter [Kiritimatiellia bacterium]MDD4342733.1 AI-2E family transporter [Kiritimatiellia bacterium]
MKLLEREFTFDRVIRLAIGAAVIGGLVYLLGLLRGVLTPFAIALLLAYLLNPLVSAIQRRIRNRPIAVILSLLLVIGIVSTAIVLLVPMLAREFAALGGLLRQAANLQLPAWVQNWFPDNRWADMVQRLSEPDIQELFTTDRLWQWAETGLQKIVPGAWKLLSGAASVMIGAVGLGIVLFYLVLLLMDYDYFQATWPNMIPEDYRDATLDFLSEFADGMRRYFRGQTAVATIVGILFACGFTLIGLPMGILLGLFIGLLNMVPYLQIIGAVPAFFLATLGALAAGTNVWVALGLCAGVFIVVQTLQDLVLIPRILGRSLGLNPVAILLSLSIWGRLLGALGLLIALPMTCLLLAWYRRNLVPSTRPPSRQPQPATPLPPPTAEEAAAAPQPQNGQK